MFKLLLLPLVFFLLVVLVSVLMAGHAFVRLWQTLTMTPEQRERAEEEYVRRTSRRFYRDEEQEPGERFGDDYFSRDTDFEQQQRQQAERAWQQQQQATRTPDGITIIDRRDPEQRNRKFFSDDDGEYVQFEEEK